MTQKLTMRWSNPIQAWVSMDGVRTWPGGGGGAAPGSGLAPQSAGILRIRTERSQRLGEAVAEHQILTGP